VGTGWKACATGVSSGYIVWIKNEHNSTFSGHLYNERGYMKTYLLTWNSAKGKWTLGLEDSIDRVKEQRYCNEPWSCGNTKKIKRGDRVFLIKLGQNPRGIMASGWVERETYKDTHWDEEMREKGKIAN
jgi:hypothetical protein